MILLLETCKGIGGEGNKKRRACERFVGAVFYLQRWESMFYASSPFMVNVFLLTIPLLHWIIFKRGGNQQFCSIQGIHHKTSFHQTGCLSCQCSVQEKVKCSCWVLRKWMFANLEFCRTKVSAPIISCDSSLWEGVVYYRSTWLFWRCANGACLALQQHQVGSHEPRLRSESASILWTCSAQSKIPISFTCPTGYITFQTKVIQNSLSVNKKTGQSLIFNSPYSFQLSNAIFHLLLFFHFSEP